MIAPTERLKLMRQGATAYKAGKESTACPYDITSGEDGQRAAIWLRGYVLARHIDNPDEDADLFLDEADSSTEPG